MSKSLWTMLLFGLSTGASADSTSLVGYKWIELDKKMAKIYCSVLVKEDSQKSIRCSYSVMRSLDSRIPGQTRREALIDDAFDIDHVSSLGDLLQRKVAMKGRVYLTDAKPYIEMSEFKQRTEIHGMPIFSIHLENIRMELEEFDRTYEIHSNYKTLRECKFKGIPFWNQTSTMRCEFHGFPRSKVKLTTRCKEVGREFQIKGEVHCK